MTLTRAKESDAAAAKKCTSSATRIVIPLRPFARLIWIFGEALRKFKSSVPMTSGEGEISLELRAAIGACARGNARGLEAVAEREAAMLQAFAEREAAMLGVLAEREAAMFRAVHRSAWRFDRRSLSAMPRRAQDARPSRPIARR